MRYAEVGQTARRSMLVTERHAELFAEMTGDRNPLHFDEAFARATRFGRRVVHGGVTAGILNAIVAEDLPGPGSVFMSQGLRYTAPVRFGDTITGEVEVLSAREDKPIVRLRCRVTRDDGTVVLEGESSVYVMRPEA
ncbi:MAG TPA: MaoC family dehydratase [Candidatus Limnocylindria bacterium]|nr:MaoC family dehydratase [Candidatus Limnocylindria bacterium]